MAKAIEVLATGTPSNQPQTQQSFHKNQRSESTEPPQQRTLSHVPSQKELAATKSMTKSMANLQSPSVAIKPQGSMSEKMSFYLNLSASNESSVQK